MNMMKKIPTLYVVQKYVGEYSDSAVINLKAFRTFNRAQDYLEKAISDAEDEERLVEWIAEKFAEFLISFPEPSQKVYSYRDATAQGLNYSEEAPFWNQFYESEYRQAHQEWEDLWFDVLSQRMFGVGLELFLADQDNKNSFRHDYRNFGQPRHHGRVEFGIDYVELGD